MRKSIGLVLLIAAATLAVVPAVALAALGVHATTSGTEGACAECHNTSATAATRGWGRATAGAPTTGWYLQPITALCWSCHSSGNTVGAHDVTAGAMNVTNHSYSILNAPPDVLNNTTRDNAAVTASALPYTNGVAAIQCTSCHNVHNDAFRPFNMKTATGANMTALCDTCHPGRNTTGLRAANVGVGGDNVSVHPVNVSMTPVTASNSMKAAGAIPAVMRNNGTAAPASNAWFLGGKLATFNAGNIECTTCHAVHGVQSAVGGAITSGVQDLLALANQAESNTVGSNPVCEGCHNGGLGTGTVGTGGTDHPVDNVRGRATFYPTGVSIPTEWTTASGRLDRGAAVFTTVAPATATQPNARCSSCHDTHGGLGTKSLLRRPIPAAAGGEWCWSCHTASEVVPRLHHSAVSTWASSQISCGSCHAGGSAPQTAAGWSSHNGFGSMDLGPDTQAAAPASSAGLNALYNTSTNAATWQFFCERCHNPQNPTVAMAGNPMGIAAGTTFTGLPSRHGVSTGTQTHLTSQFTAPQVLIRDQDRTFNSYIRAGAAGTNGWGNTSTNAYSPAVEIKSKYNLAGGAGTITNPTTITGGTAAVVICESCHNLIFNGGTPVDTNDVTAGYDANLLVWNFADDGQGSTFTVSAGHSSQPAVTDALCRGCHSAVVLTSAQLAALGTAPAANTYVHYPAAHTQVSSSFSYGTTTPYGRSTGTILTDNSAACPNRSTADAAAPPGAFSYPAANTLNCDSCHRAHNANALGTNGLAFSAANAATVEMYALEPGAYLTVANQAKTQACTQCHNDQVQCGY